MYNLQQRETTARPDPDKTKVKVGVKNEERADESK